MSVLQLVEREQLRLRRLHVGAALALAVALTATILVAGGLALGGARWLALPRGAPFLVWVLIVGGNGAIVWFTLQWLRRRATRAGVARTIEEERSLRRGALRAVLEVGESGELGRMAAAAMSDRLTGLGPTLAPRAQHLARRRGAWVAGGALVATALLALVAPVFSDGLLAILRPIEAWNGTLLPAIELRNLPPAIIRGEMLVVDIIATGRSVLTLDQRSLGEAWHRQELDVGDDGLAKATIGPVRGDIHLLVSDGRAATDTVIVRVTDRPFVAAVAMRATYPGYLSRPAEGLPIGEPARVPFGTIIEITGRASTALRSIRLVAGGDTIGLEPAGHAFAGSFPARKSSTWRWIATGPGGSIGDLPLPVELEVVPDSAPRADLVSPAMDTMVAGTDRIVLRMAAVDDHGLSRIELHSWRVTSQSAQRPTEERLAETRDVVWTGAATLDLAPRGLQPGDALHVKVVATDNSPWGGGQRGESRELVLRIPTNEERRALARATGDSAALAAQAMAAAQRALERRTDEAARDRGDRPQSADKASSSNAKNDMTYEAAEKARAVAKDQRALTDQVKALEQAAKNLEEQLKQAGALDSSLARQLQEAQSLLREALTPELLAQMQKLEKSAQQLSREESQNSLQELKEMQRRLREQLEKSAQMLKRAALEGTMQTLSDEARELAEKQQRLADSALRAATAQRDSGLKTDAQKLAERTDRLGNDMQKLEERLARERADAGATRTGEARQHAATSEQKLREGGQQLQPAASEMEKSAQSMQDARNAQIQEWKKELTSELDKAIQEMLQMAREESSLEQKARAGNPKQEDLRGQQSAVKQGLDEAAKRLEQEAQKSSLLSSRSQRAISEAQQRVEQATQQTAQQQNAQAASSMGQASDALNRAAASLARDRERANSSGSATGFAEMMQQLQEMANKQGAINSQAQGLMQLPSGQATAAEQATARALARQQRQVAQQLEELGDGAGGDRAAKLAQEARQLAEALEGGRIDAATLARQEQLFRRLLDAGRSLEKEEREESDRREAKAASGTDRFSPTNANAAGKGATRFREPTWDELRGLSADERRAILEYFKKINGGKGG
jgi:hypothetical protein